jgi:hypothetical protein
MGAAKQNDSAETDNPGGMGARMTFLFCIDMYYLLAAFINLW